MSVATAVGMQQHCSSADPSATKQVQYQSTACSVIIISRFLVDDIALGTIIRLSVLGSDGDFSHAKIRTA
jgi:branched-subunit amino acid permease